MIFDLLLASAFVAVLTGLLWPILQRRKLYAALANRLAGSPQERLLALSGLAEKTLPSFADRLATLTDALPAPVFNTVVRDAEKLVSPERSYIPTHKKGGTVAYETIIAHAPAIAALYQSCEMRELVSRLVGETVKPTPIHDQSSLSLLVYDRPGDHIAWHYDHNFYKGRHFTVLIPLVNRGSGENGLSHACLTAKLPGGDLDIATPPNKMVAFEGARVLHKVAPIIENERRLVLSMTYCTDPREGWWQGIARRVKDTAFFGVRALWT